MNLLIVVLLLIKLSSLNAFNGVPRVGCRDENNNLVDWYYTYKLPNNAEQNYTANLQNVGLSHGLNYLFITSETPENWILSKKMINDTNSIVGRTLAPMYLKKNKLMILLYNDQPPTGDYDDIRGHTKGVIVGNSQGGFWLIHSVPRFPPEFNTKYDYPKSGAVYGQSFLCITFNSVGLSRIGKQLKFNEPHFYSSQFPSSLKSIYQDLFEALSMEEITAPPYYNIETLTSSKGKSFVSFAKTRKFKKELYEDWVAPYFNVGDYYAETWRHGKGNIDSDCSGTNHVLNIDNISFPKKRIAFSTMKDHSKWLVSNKNNWICVGDINRQQHQKVRGGGTVCQQMPGVSSSYKNLINSIEACPKNTKKSKQLRRKFNNSLNQLIISQNAK